MSHLHTPRRAFVSLRLLAVIIYAILTLFLKAEPAAAWNSLPTDRRGVCRWNEFAPQCQVPPGCTSQSSSHAHSNDDNKEDNAKAVQASPVTFTEDELKKAKKLAKSNFARIIPMVQPVDRLTGKSIMELMPTTVASQMRLEVDGGGVLTATCMDRAPLFVAISSKRPKALKNVPNKSKHNDPVYEEEKEEEEVEETQHEVTHAVRDTPIPRNMVYEVMQIQFYNGMLHEWPVSSSYPPSKSLDIEIHLREAKVTYSTADSTVYQSICTANIMSRQGPDLIISMPMITSATERYSINLLTIILSNMTKETSLLLKGGSYEIDLGMTIPLISTQNGAERMEFPFIHYVGSVAQPPCTPKVPRLQLLNSIAVPSNALTALKRIAKNQQNANGGLRYPLLPTSALHSGKLAVWDTTAHPDDKVRATKSKRGRKSRRKAGKKHDSSSSIDFTVDEVKFYRDAIPVLVTINIILLSYLLLLLFARLEWLDWPTALGGLNHPVQFYTRAYEEMEALKAAGLRVPQTTPAPDTHDNSAADAKEEDGEEDGEEDVAGHVATDVLSTVQ